MRASVAKMLHDAEMRTAENERLRRQLAHLQRLLLDQSLAHSRGHGELVTTLASIVEKRATLYEELSQLLTAAGFPDHDADTPGVTVGLRTRVERLIERYQQRLDAWDGLNATLQQEQKDHDALRRKAFDLTANLSTQTALVEALRRDAKHNYTLSAAAVIDRLEDQLSAQITRAQDAERKLDHAEHNIYGYLSTRQAEELAAKATKENAALRSVVEKLEWCGTDAGGYIGCPVCGGSWAAILNHAPGCILKAALDGTAAPHGEK